MISKVSYLTCLLILIGYVNTGLASYQQKYSILVGSENATVAENESTLEQTDTSVKTEEEEPTSTAVMSMNIRLDYTFLNKEKWETFTSISAPLMASPTGSLWTGGIGVNYYFMGSSSMLRYRSTSAFFTSHSTLTCYVGSSGGVGYIVYQSESKKSADFAFNLGAHAGASYSINKKWGLKAEAGMARWIGSMSSSMGMRMFVGMVSTI